MTTRRQFLRGIGGTALLGANATAPFVTVGRVAYTTTAGVADSVPCRRNNEAFVDPPKQVSVKNRSPLSGSRASGLGQVRPVANVAIVAPVAEFTLTMRPEFDPLPVAFCNT